MADNGSPFGGLDDWLHNAGKKAAEGGMVDQLVKLARETGRTNVDDIPIELQPGGQELDLDQAAIRSRANEILANDK